MSPERQVCMASEWTVVFATVVELPSSLNLAAYTHLDVMGRSVDRLMGFDPLVDRYASVDARLSWQPHKNLEDAAIGRNLLGQCHSEFGTVPVLKSLMVEIRRGVSAKNTWRS